MTGIYSQPIQYPTQPENAMRSRAGLRPLCFNREDYSEHVTVRAGIHADGRQQFTVVPNAMTTGCKAWAVHPQEDPATESIPGREGWRCWGCRLLPSDPRVVIAAAGAEVA